MTDAKALRFSMHGGHSGSHCRHARGTLEEVVEAAAAGGFSVLGLSEHAPRFAPEHLYDEERTAGVTVGDLWSDFCAYVAEARRLQAACAGRLEILVGMETEVVPEDGWAETMLDLRMRFAIDYLVGSVHHVAGTIIDGRRDAHGRAAERCGGVEPLFVAYYDRVAEMVERLRPEVVAHLDLVRLHAPDQPLTPPIVAALDRALERVAGVEAVLDVNGKALAKGLTHPYPVREILERSRSMAIDVTLGDDSHGPDEVGRHLDQCLAAVRAAGYRRVVRLRRARGGGVVREAIAV